MRPGGALRAFVFQAETIEVSKSLDVISRRLLSRLLRPFSLFVLRAGNILARLREFC